MLQRVANNRNRRCRRFNWYISGCDTSIDKAEVVSTSVIKITRMLVIFSGIRIPCILSSLSIRPELLDLFSPGPDGSHCRPSKRGMCVHLCAFRPFLPVRSTYRQHSPVNRQHQLAQLRVDLCRCVYGHVYPECAGISFHPLVTYCGPGYAHRRNPTFV